jgi:hypothetical protein
MIQSNTPALQEVPMRLSKKVVLYELVHSYKRRLVRGFVCWCLSNLVDRRGAIVNGNLELVLHSLKIEQILLLWRAALYR